MGVPPGPQRHRRVVVHQRGQGVAQLLGLGGGRGYRDQQWSVECVRPDGQGGCVTAGRERPGRVRVAKRRGDQLEYAAQSFRLSHGRRSPAAAPRRSRSPATPRCVGRPLEVGGVRRLARAGQTLEHVVRALLPANRLADADAKAREIVGAERLGDGTKARCARPVLRPVSVAATGLEVELVVSDHEPRKVVEGGAPQQGYQCRTRFVHERGGYGQRDGPLGVAMVTAIARWAPLERERGASTRGDETDRLAAHVVAGSGVLLTGFASPTTTRCSGCLADPRA